MKTKLIVFLLPVLIAETLLICAFVTVFSARFPEEPRWDWETYGALSEIRYDDEGGLPTGTDFYQVMALRPAAAGQSEREIAEYERSAAAINDVYLTDYLGRVSVMFMKTYGYDTEMRHEILAQTNDALVYRLYDDSHAWQVWVSRPSAAEPRVAVYREQES
jgi:hypothetical protein